MFCPYCGFKMVEGGSFCPSCGKANPLRNDAQQENSQPEFDLIVSLAEVTKKLDGFYLNKSSYWYRNGDRDRDTWRHFYGTKYFSEHQTLAAEPIEIRFEAVNYIEEKIRQAQSALLGGNDIDAYIEFILELARVSVFKKYQDAGLLGGCSWYHLLHIVNLELFTSEAALSLAKRLTKNRWSTFTNHEIKLLLDHMNQADKERCFSEVTIYGNPMVITIEHDMDGFYSTWLKCKNADVELDTVDLLRKFRIRRTKITSAIQPSVEEAQRSIAKKASVKASDVISESAPSQRPRLTSSDLEAYKENHAKCPKCGSISISTQKKGFGFGKAAAGAVAVGPIGALFGGVGAQKMFNICQSCGHSWELKK